MNKTRIVERLFYGGVKKEEFASIKHLINEENHRVWKVISIIAEILFVGLFIFALVEPNHKAYIVPFSILAGVMILFVLAFLVFLKPTSKALLPFIYVASVTILAVFIYTGSYVEKDRPGVVFPALALGLALVTLDRPLRNSLVPVLGLAVYIPLIITFKSDVDVMLTDILTSSIFTLTGIALSIFISRIRIRDLLMRKNAEIDRDKDALTEVANKLAYDRKVEEISLQMKQGDIKFAIAVFDINELKVTNDTYGHGEGDKLLIRCTKIIEESFPNSTTYRIGGDEFAVIIMDQDYANRERLIRELHERIRISHEKSTSLLDDTPIAFGVAVYNKQKDRDYVAVFSRADAEMYDNKRVTKARNNYQAEQK